MVRKISYPSFEGLIEVNNDKLKSYKINQYISIPFIGDGKINIDNNINYNYLKPYLAGLIEGDGTIWVYNNKNISNINKVTLKIPKISVVFNVKDKPLADYLCDITKCGIVNKKKGNHVLWEIQNFHEVYYIISLINGYMRTPKYEALSRAILWYNNYIIKYKNMDISKSKLKGWDIINVPRSIKLCKNIDIIKDKGLDESELFSNSWLSGMTDADGNFSLSLYKKKRINIWYRLELKQSYESKYSNNDNNNYFTIMSKISKMFNSKLYTRSRELNLCDTIKLYHSYIVMVSNKNNISLVKKYFNKYPLLSSKNNDYKDWSEVSNIIEIKGQNIETYKYVEKIRNNYNKTRKIFNWDHLNI